MKIGRIVVMGVSGCGKSSIGKALADRVAVPFFDADDFHPPANVAKMAAGRSLTDADRAGWLDDLARLLAEHRDMVLACSALKRSYRDRLRQVEPGPRFLYLHGRFDTIRDRMNRREGHYFKGADLLKTQFEELELPDARNAAHIPVDAPADEVLTRCLTALNIPPDKE